MQSKFYEARLSQTTWTAILTSGSSQRSAPEPEAEDLLVENAAAPPQDDMGLDDDIPAEIPELVREYPTLEEYQPVGTV